MFKKILLGAGGALAVIFLYAYRLSFPPEMYYDEVYHVKTARDLASFVRFTNSSHPPLGDFLISLSLRFFGDHSWAWRFFPLVCGLATLLILYLLTKKLTQSVGTALLATTLFSLDCVSLTQARMAMVNTPMLLWMLLSLLCITPFAVDGTPPNRKAFLLAGFFFGLALATKLVAVMLLGTFVIFLWKPFLETEQKGLFLKNIFLFLFVAPCLVYIAMNAVIPLTKYGKWADLWKYQTLMMNYHAHLKATHRYSSVWWSWPLMIRPVWYYFKRDHGLVYGILSIGNPAIVWTIPAALGCMAWLFWKKKSWMAGLVLGGFLTEWLPYGFFKRVQFFHYFDTAMPFVAIALAILLEKIWRSGKIGRWMTLGYLALAAGMLIYWYPLLTGFPISEACFRHHLWFKSWV